MLLFNCSFVCMFFRSLLGETEMKKKWWQAQRTIVFVSLLAILVSLLALLMPKLAPDKSEPTASKTAEQPLSPKLAVQPGSQKSGVQVPNPTWDPKYQIVENCLVLLVKTEGSLQPIFDRLVDYEILYTFPTTQPVPAEEYILIIRPKPPVKPPVKEKQSDETP